MAKQIFTNGATALLAGSIDDNDLSIQVANGYGALFPNPGADEYFIVTLVNSNGDREYVKIESRSTDILTVAASGRGQDGSSAQSWTAGQTRVECRVTKGTLDTFIQRGGDAMEGDLDMDDNEIQNVNVTGDSKWEGGEIVDTPIRGVSGDSSNEIVVPSDGTRATAGGDPILCEGDDLSDTVFATGMIMLWYGSALSVPTGWAICNGSNDTPDLRDKFVVGAGSTYALDDSGGSTSNTPTISADGDHSHGGATGSTVLTEANMPEHNHRLFVWESGSSGPGQMENFGNSGIGPARGVAGNADSNTYAYREATVEGNDLIEAAGGDGEGHSHTISASGTHTHTASAVSTLPPYKALYYIMKVA